MIRKRRTLHSERRRVKKRKVQIFKTALIVFCAVGIVGSLAFLSRNPFFSIDSIEAKGIGIVDGKELQAKTENLLQGFYWGLFSKKNIFTFPRHQIENEIYASFPAIESMKIKRAFPRTLVLEIKEHKPAGLWCGVSVGDGPCYFLNDKGFVFSKASEFSPQVYVHYYGALSKQIPLRSYFLSGHFEEVHSILSVLENFSLTPLRLSLNSDNEAEVTVSPAGRIIFNAIKDIPLARTNLDAFLRENQNDWKRKGIHIDYIDLRFGNKLFYKLK